MNKRTSYSQRAIDEPHYAIAFDIGGTKVAGAVVSSDGKVFDKIVTPPPSVTSELTTTLLEVVQTLRARYPVQAIGIGAAGIVEWPRGYIRWAPNNAYQQLPLRELVSHATGLPTIVDNDANAATWAEARLGEMGYTDMAYLTVGTGIGGGVVLDGKLYRGRSGLATEIGHLIVNPDGALCGCGNRGCLEAMASGTALERIARESAVVTPNSYLAPAAKNSNSPTGRTVHRAALAGDSLATSLFEQIGYWLGVGIASLVNIFELEAVVVGGGLSETGDLLLGPARLSCDRHAFARQHRKVPPIIPSAHGIDAGLVGAAHLALHYLAS